MALLMEKQKVLDGTFDGDVEGMDEGTSVGISDGCIVEG